MPWIVNEDAAARLFVWWTPSSMLCFTSLGGMQLAEICFMSVSRSYSELHSLLHISIMPGSIMSMRMLLTGCSYHERLQASSLWLPWVECSSQNLFHIRPSFSLRAAHYLVSPVHHYYGSYTRAVEYQWGCCCLAVRRLNVSKHGMFYFSGRNIAHRNLFHILASSPFRDAHPIAL